MWDFEAFGTPDEGNNSQPIKLTTEGKLPILAAWHVTDSNLNGPGVVDNDMIATIFNPEITQGLWLVAVGAVTANQIDGVKTGAMMLYDSGMLKGDGNLDTARYLAGAVCKPYGLAEASSDQLPEPARSCSNIIALAPAAQTLG
jgi:hypothetical protein